MVLKLISKSNSSHVFLTRSILRTTTARNSKKYEESSTARPFSVGALMVLTGLTGPDQLHPGPRTPSRPPEAISPHPSGAAAGPVSIPSPGRCPMAWAVAAPVPLAALLLARVVGQGQPGYTPWLHTPQPQRATSPCRTLTFISN